MATFEVRVEGLTGLSLDGSSSPTQDELTEYLKDGVIEITNRCTLVKPNERSLFTRKNASDSQGVEIGRAKIISVLREANADGSSDGSTAWRACREVPVFLQSRVVDVDSLDYASIYNPVYTIDDTGIVNVYPTPSSNNGIEVYYVNNTPVNGSGSSLIFSHDDIKYFPSDKIYLVVLYAGMKSLENALSAKTSDFPDDVDVLVLESYSTSLPNYSAPDGIVIPPAPVDADVSFTNVGSIESFVSPVFSVPDLTTIGSMTLPSVPVAPTMSEKSITITGTPPTYTKPEIVLSPAPTISDLSISINPPVAPSLSNNSITLPTSGIPEYVAPSVTPDFADAEKWITTEEDSEMLASRMQEISARLNQYGSDIQNATQKMNEDNIEYQAKLQKSIQDAQLSQTDDSQKVQKFATEINKYTAKVNEEVSAYTQNLNKEMQLFTTKRQTELQQYGSDIQNELNEFNKENIEYQALLQKDIQDAQLKESKEGRDLQKYSQEMGAYQAEVNKEVQRWTNEDYNVKFNEWTQRYQAKLAEYNSDIQKETQRVSASVADFNAEVSKSIQTYQSETGYDLSKYQAEIGAQVQRYQNDLATNSTTFDKDLAKYTTDYTRAVNINGASIANYSADIQNYAAKIQKVSADYEWMTARLMKLQQQYDTAFAIMQPRQQQQEGR